MVEAKNKKVINKPKVAIVFGGKSEEHSISCLTASKILQAIDRNKYDVSAIGITKKGEWYRVSSDFKEWEPRQNKKGEIIFPEVKAPITNFKKNQSLVKLKMNPEEIKKVDIVFPALHGVYGEDGTIQGLLELLDISYIGCGVTASAIGQDKDSTKKLAVEAGVNVAPWVSFRTPPIMADDYQLPNNLDKQVREMSGSWKQSLFVKPARSGSSIGISKVDNNEQLILAIKKASKYDSKIIIEQEIVGREIEVGLLGSRYGMRVSTFGEIKIKDTDFYNFEAKYMDSEKAQLIINPPIDPEIKTKIRENALKISNSFDLEGLSQESFFLTPAGKIYFNEANTLPGFTSISLFPKLWEHDGINITSLISELIDEALARPKKRGILR
ncbi:MAG: D-alanine--D-alanine ligase [Candidatus Ancillula sp.]|nr:D-alanine--D-alanine ligase [Candidatus Ancillula sp.]